MIQRNPACFFLVFFFFFFVFLIINPSSAIAEKNEDIAHLSLKKTAISKEKLDTYVVQKGDWIFNIIRHKFGASEKEILEILQEVRRLNPDIKDLHRIEPGQKLLLPPVEIQADETIKPSKGKEKSSLQAKGTPSSLSADLKSTSHYVVKEGETLSDIIHNELDVSYDDIYNLMRTVKRLNPNVKNINKIYPGQKLLLPFAKKERIPAVTQKTTVRRPLKKEKIVKEEISEKKIAEKKVVVTPQKKVLTLRYILSRINGKVIGKGNYYIPLFPSGQVTVNCSAVPVVELDDGMTILLDFSGRIPEGLKQVIESTWKNYKVINVEQNREIPSILKQIISNSNEYMFKDVGKLVTMGKQPAVGIFVDWAVSKKITEGKTPYGFGIRRVESRTALLPGNVRVYADRKGFEVVELLSGTEVAAISDTYESLEIPLLKSDTNVALAESLLTTLGYAPSRHSEVEIYNIEKHGFKLDYKVDLFVPTGHKKLIMHSQKIPQHIQDILKKRGTEVVHIPEGEKKEKVFDLVLSSLATPYIADTFRFSFAQWRGKPGGEILLPAIRAKNKDGLVYFIDHGIDNDIYGLLHKKWGVNLIEY